MNIPRQIVLFLIFAGSTTYGASLDDLDFMTGRWQRSSSDGVVEEWWMSAEGNTKVAAFRWAKGSGVIAIEFVIISEEDDGLFLRFKHFSADYEPWEKDEPNTYKLKSIESDTAIFLNTAPRDGVPNVIIYRKTVGGLEFRGTDDSDGVSTDSDFIIRFRRAKDR